MKTLLCTFALFLVALCEGLAQTNTIVTSPDSTLINLSNLMANADHIIVTNANTGFDSRRRGFSLTISGDEVRKIMKAVTGARLRCAPPCTGSLCLDELQFYRGVQMLAVIHLEDSYFVVGDVHKGREYKDDSGALHQFWLDLVNKEAEQGSH
jgi:hypothetical protein